MAKTSKTMLSNNGESGQPCLVPDLRGNGFSFSSMVSVFRHHQMVSSSHVGCGFVIYGLYCVEVGSLYAYFLEGFFVFFVFFFFFLFMAMLGLCFCARAFSSCSERGPLFIAVRGPLTIAASLVA